MSAEVSATMFPAPGGWYHSQAPEASKQIQWTNASGSTGNVVKGVFHSLFIENKSGATRFIYVFDATSTSGTIIAGPFVVPANQNVGIEYPSGKGRNFTTGLLVAASSSDAAYSSAGVGSDCWFEVGFSPVL